MGATEVLSRKSGVIVGDDVLRLFEYAREKQFAIPAIVSRAIIAANCFNEAVGS
jgi:fructose-bisphosphate aldolase class II